MQHQHHSIEDLVAHIALHHPPVPSVRGLPSFLSCLRGLRSFGVVRRFGSGAASPFFDSPPAPCRAFSYLALSTQIDKQPSVHRHAMTSFLCRIPKHGSTVGPVPNHRQRRCHSHTFTRGLRQRGLVG
ncbi:hypothetical protein Mapa_017416 [Marchantia paleacea]|nr:hypothetical protein Mapa_017416 [Marchantia paleacea]